MDEHERQWVIGRERPKIVTISKIAVYLEDSLDLGFGGSTTRPQPGNETQRWPDPPDLPLAARTATSLCEAKANIGQTC